MFLIILPAISLAEDIPNPNAEGIKKVLGIVKSMEYVPSSREASNQSGTLGNPVWDLAIPLIEAIFHTNYAGFPIYHVKVDENITLEVASRETFKIEDCVLVWYDEAMGDNPNLSMLGQAGITKNNGCNR